METATTPKTFEIKTETQKGSQFTLLVYFKPQYAENGSENGRKFHSDKYELVEKRGKLVTDHKFAYDTLLTFMLKELSGRYKTAIIYHNPTNSIVMKMAYNTFRFGKEVVFKSDSTGLGSVFHGFSTKIRSVN